MGSHQSSTEQFNESNWKEISSPFNEIIQYENNVDHNIHIQRHRIRTTSEQQYDKIKEISFIRKHNPRWVAAVYFQEEQAEDTEFCVSKYEASLFLQKIPIRLCDLRNIPFPDVLHLYDQALNGFYQLARVVGCFPVESDYIGINERGVVKVWAGSKWSQITVKGGAISQEDMVRSIVECLEESIDKYSMPQQNPSIRNYLYRTADRINFEQAIAELKNFSKTTSAYGIPTRLHSIQENPGRYDTERMAQRQLVMAQLPPNYFNSQSSSQIPPHYSPRFSPQRQGGHEQITTFRKVDSLSNEPIHRPPPISNFAVQRQRAVTSYQSNGTILKSGSNPQLINGINKVRPSNSNIQSSHRVSIGSNISPQASQQVINHIYQPIYSVNTNIQQPPFSVPYPIFQQNQVINQQNGQMVRTSFANRPSSQDQLHIQPVLHKQVTVDKPPTPKMRPLQSYSQQNSRPISRKNTIQGQSIIMQLYNSQDNTTLAPNTSVGETKHFGNIKRSQSYHVDLKRFDSATVINDSQSGSMRGVPQVQVKYFVSNKNQFSNLNSIEEVQTEHNQRQNGSRNNSNHRQYANNQPYSLIHLDQTSKPIVFKKNQHVVDENDGKSSEDFLRKLKEMSYQTVPNSAFQIMPGSTFNSGFIQKKKSVGFADTRDVIDIDGSRRKEITYKPGEYNFGRSAQSKQESLMNDYYDNTMFANISQGHPGIDPDIWADIQRYQE